MARPTFRGQVHGWGFLLAIFWGFSLASDSYLRIDNNRVENDIRPFVVGRKNWLFAGKPEGSKASATIYSLLETAKANGWEPYAYLTFLFRSLPLAKTQEDWQSLLPTNGPQTATGLTSTAQSQAVP